MLTQIVVKTVLQIAKQSTNWHILLVSVLSLMFGSNSFGSGPIRPNPGLKVWR